MNEMKEEKTHAEQLRAAETAYAVEVTLFAITLLILAWHWRTLTHAARFTVPYWIPCALALGVGVARLRNRKNAVSDLVAQGGTVERKVANVEADVSVLKEDMKGLKWQLGKVIGLLENGQPQPSKATKQDADGTNG